MLTIHPDGGVARLRVHGRPVPDPALLTGTIDLAALENGGDVVACSDMFYAAARNLLMPGRARTTGEGWENARRRDGGNDYVTIRLAGPGVGAAARRGHHLLPRQRAGLRAGARHLGRARLRPASSGSSCCRARTCSPTPGTCSRSRSPPPRRPSTHVRVDVYPDGGMARLRVLGELR